MIFVCFQTLLREDLLAVVFSRTCTLAGVAHRTASNSMADDWLFDSITKYRALHMYDLQHAVSAIDWVGDRGLCLACCYGDRSEILELLLPDKLVARKDDTSIVKDRDFQMVNGGFCDRKIRDIRHIPDSRMLAVTEDDVNCISMWRLGSDQSDMVEKVCEIANSTPQCCPAQATVTGPHGKGGRLLFGSHLDNICIVEVDTEKVLQTTSDLSEHSLISCICMLDNNTAMCCVSDTGKIVLLDIREPKIATSKHNCQGNTASFWTMHVEGSDGNRGRCSQLSSNGEILTHDTRCMQKRLTCQQTELNTDHSFKYLHITEDPVTRLQVAVSGFDDKLYVYNSVHWSDDCKSSTISPVFVHEGHSANSDNQSEELKVVTHTWHPWQQDLILSGATDGSLHAWQHIDK
ncbi:hypothetical protein ScPMuIL_018469 [Solemya velum]